MPYLVLTFAWTWSWWWAAAATGRPVTQLPVPLLFMLGGLGPLVGAAWVVRRGGPEYRREFLQRLASLPGLRLQRIQLRLRARDFKLQQARAGFHALAFAHVDAHDLLVVVLLDDLPIPSGVAELDELLPDLHHGHLGPPLGRVSPREATPN